VLIDANQAALEDAEKSLKRIGVNIAARPFVLGVIANSCCDLFGITEK
jgi:hypothetical protein